MLSNESYRHYRLQKQAHSHAVRPFTLCAVEGWRVGGGVALSVALDLRIAGQDARFHAAEIQRGMNTSCQSVPRMVALIRPAPTKRLMILAQRVDAPTAQDWGLVDEVAGSGAHSMRPCRSPRRWPRCRRCRRAGQRGHQRRIRRVAPRGQR
jgi:enoyl-CoA hydratase/carnithine racemase